VSPAARPAKVLPAAARANQIADRRRGVADTLEGDDGGLTPTLDRATVDRDDIVAWRRRRYRACAPHAHRERDRQQRCARSP
jgi:hypothetical protein